MIDNAMLTTLVDFFKWIWNRVSGVPEKPEFDPLSYFLSKRARLEKHEVGLIEFFESDIGRWFDEDFLFKNWETKMLIWYPHLTPGELIKREVQLMLKDWGNDEHAIIISKKDDDGNTRWKISDEYAPFRILPRDDNATIWRKPENSL